MAYKEISDGFLKEYPDYKSDIDNFKEYLERYWKQSLSGEPFRVLLKGIDVEFILKSLIYNVEEIERYKSKAKAKRYATVIGQFFTYVRKNTDIANSELYDAISFSRLREDSYMNRMVMYIEKCGKLAGVVEQEALMLSQAEIILRWSNEQLDEWEWDDSTKFRKAMAALGIKMMMLYGITYRELRKIKWEQYDKYYGFIVVNGFELRLPPKLSIQMQRMNQFVSAKRINNKDGLVFVDRAGQPWAEITSYSGIPDYLGALIGVTSVTSVIKYGIGQLLKAGLSDSVIKKMTGASEKLIQGCLMHNELKKIINNKLVMVEMYYEF